MTRFIASDSHQRHGADNFAVLERPVAERSVAVGIDCDSNLLYDGSVPPWDRQRRAYAAELNQ